MNNYNIILFDAYGTLFKIKDENPAIDFLPGEKKNEFFNLWRRKLLEYSWLTSLMGEFEEFDIIVSKAIEFCCEDLDLPFKQLEPALLNIYTHPILFHDVRNTLSELNESGVRCCIISNGSSKTLENAVHENQIQELIHIIFSASEVRKFKVSPDIYSLPTNYFNLNPEEIFFVSSNAWDISGALNFGFKTIWLNRAKSTFDTLVKRPNYEISGFEEIKTIIRKE